MPQSPLQQPALDETATASNPAHTEADVAAIDELRDTYQKVRTEIGKIIIGQDEVIEKLLICVFSRGHAPVRWHSRTTAISTR